LFAHYGVRRLDAEVLLDALCMLLGEEQGYTSAIPEPFTHIPAHHRTITLADGSTSNPFLEMFGRPARDTGLGSERNNEPTDEQRLHLLNSSRIQNMIRQSTRLRGLLKTANRRRRNVIGMVYLTVLSRYPTRAEMAIVREYARTEGLRPAQIAIDLVWALINTKEFLYRH